MNEFPIYRLDDFKWFGDETMGTKARDWYGTTDQTPELETNKLWLFKVPSRFRGELWAERITAEIGRLMGLPIAPVELARLEQPPEPLMGTISKNFADERDGRSLEHGNELMEVQASLGDYVRDTENQLGLDAVYDYFRGHGIKAPLEAAGFDPAYKADFYFTGYLVFDALINNVDRHHQNWGVVRTIDGAAHLAPSYDHGASLGRELQKKKRENYLASAQAGQYATNNKGRAKIAPPGQHERVAPFQLLSYLPSLEQTQALSFWLERALAIEDGQLSEWFAAIPAHLISPDATEFARALMSFTRTKLQRLYEETR